MVHIILKTIYHLSFIKEVIFTSMNPINKEYISQIKEMKYARRLENINKKFNFYKSFFNSVILKGFCEALMDLSGNS